MGSLVLGGVELQPDHRRWRLWIQQGRDELPETRDYSDVIPFRRGRVHRASIGDRRTILLQGFIGETSEAALRSSLDALKRVLDPELEEPELLVDTLPDGSTRWIPVIPRNVMSVPGNPVWRNQSWELEALDPYWYGSYGFAALDSGLLLNDGHYLDEGAAVVVVPTSTSHAISLDTLGNADVERVMVRFKGPSVGGVGIENATNGTGFVLPAITAASSPLPAKVTVVDNLARTVVDYAGASLRASLVLRDANLHGEYLRLDPGLNTLRILGQPAEARIQFVPTYN